MTQLYTKGVSCLYDILFGLRIAVCLAIWRQSNPMKNRYIMERSSVNMISVHFQGSAWNIQFMVITPPPLPTTILINILDIAATHSTIPIYLFRVHSSASQGFFSHSGFYSCQSPSSPSLSFVEIQSHLSNHLL